MSQKLFTPEEVQELQASPYVESVSSRSVCFTPSFKQQAYNELQAGKSMREIFESCGINTGALGPSRVNGFREKVEKAAARKEGFANLRKEQHKPREQAPEDKLERRIRQLEHELAYAKQQIDFLKKLQQADTEARKQWESKQRPK